MFNKNLFAFLLIIISLNSSNIFTMKKQGNINKEKLMGIVGKLKDKYNISAMFEQDINEWNLSYIIDDNELFDKQEQNLKKDELINIIKILKDSEIERIKYRLDTARYLDERDFNLMIKELKALKSDKVRNLIELIGKKIEEFIKKKSETKDLMSLAKGLGKSFTIGSSKDEKPKSQPKTPFSDMTPEERRKLNEFQ
jgi:hypothetical protein